MVSCSYSFPNKKNTHFQSAAMECTVGSHGGEAVVEAEAKPPEDEGTASCWRWDNVPMLITRLFLEFLLWQSVILYHICCLCLFVEVVVALAVVEVLVPVVTIVLSIILLLLVVLFYCELLHTYNYCVLSCLSCLCHCDNPSIVDSTSHQEITITMQIPTFGIFVPPTLVVACCCTTLFLGSIHEDISLKVLDLS